MSSNEKALGVTGVPEPYDEKNYMDGTTHATVSAPLDGDAGGVVVHDLEVTALDLEKIESKIRDMPTDRCKHIISQLYTIHKYDQNFPRAALDRMKEFMDRPDHMDHVQEHEDDKMVEDDLLKEMKLEAILATENSPYLEVRANVEATDDYNMPSLTFRVLFIGTIASAAGSFIDTLFANRLPPIAIGANVAQLLAYPIGKFMATILPTGQFRLFGKTMSFNPGPFSRKEHMLITIMANVSFSSGYTNSIIPTQAMPFFFDMSFARKFGYQLLNTIGFTFVGYGLAGLTRRFLVYPSVAVWPSSLATVALNKSFHTSENEPVRGPFNKIFKMSREKFFLLTFGAMFIWFWFPGFLFPALSSFSWITWIAPNNIKLSAITGFTGGMGINPWPTFDWNVLNSNGTVPLTLPSFTIVNQLVGIIAYTLIAIAVYYTNAWNTAYLPINTNKVWANTGKRYNVTKVLDQNKNLDPAKYQQYSEPWMGAAYIVCFIMYFAMYSATVTYVALYHRHDLKIGFGGFMRSIRRQFNRSTPADEDDILAEDIHERLMKKYKEVPEWCYLIVLVIAAVCGMVGVGVYPTHVTPAVVVFGILMPLIVMIPCGLIQAVSGLPIPLNVIAEFIGGAIVPGNANSLIYFKTYGYIATYQALAFSSDLKLAHYLKIPPWHTFTMQIWATIIYCFVCAGLQNFVLAFKDVCTAEAKFQMACPGANTFFTSAVFWGTLGPARLFGPGKRYNLMLLGFPVGVVLVLVLWGLRKKFPRSELLRQCHPVMWFAGPAYWGPPLNMSYFLGNVYVTLLSFTYIRKRYASFWAKYNYVLAASFPCAIAIASVIIFFGTSIPKNGTIAPNWWGYNVANDPEVGGCEIGGCPRLTVAKGEVFGPPVGSGLFT